MDSLARGWILQMAEVMARALGAEDEDAGIWIEIHEDEARIGNDVRQG